MVAKEKSILPTTHYARRWESGEPAMLRRESILFAVCGKIKKNEKNAH